MTSSCRYEILRSLKFNDGWEDKAMTHDEVVKQVRQAREQNAAKFNYDLKAIVADARKRQKESGHRVVSLASKPKSSPPA
jgi:hypothetical protein